MYRDTSLASHLGKIEVASYNANFDHMDRLIKNAENHGETSVALALSRTLDDLYA